MAKSPRPFRPYVPQEYPKKVWNPATGVSMVAKGPADVPDGWLSHHPDDPKHEGDPKLAVTLPVPKTLNSPASPPAPSDEDRAAIIAQLRQNGVSFAPRASTKALRELLGA